MNKTPPISTILSFIVTTALLLLFVPTNISAQTIVCAPEEYQTESIGSYEIRKVGDGSVPPARIVIFYNGLNGQVYFEVDPEQLDVDVDGGTEEGEENDDSSSSSSSPTLFVEFYANLDDDDDDYCDAGNGILIDNDSVDFSYSTFQFTDDEYQNQFVPQESQDECFPRTTNGVVTAVQFSFTDIFYDQPSTMTILDPSYYQQDGGGSTDTDSGTTTTTNNNNYGLLNFCVRVGFKQRIPTGIIGSNTTTTTGLSYSVDDDDDEFELISFLDTKIRADVDITTANIFYFNSSSSSSEQDNTVQQMYYSNPDFTDSPTTTTPTTTSPTTTTASLPPAVANIVDDDNKRPLPHQVGTIDRFELKAVGEAGGKPLGQIVSLDPFTGIGFFEAHPSQFENSINSAITVELFANVPEMDESNGKIRSCVSGVLLESGDGFLIDTESYEFPNYNEIFEGIEGLNGDDGSSSLYPHTKNGKVGAAKYFLSDVNYYPSGSEKQIYFPADSSNSNQQDNSSTIEYCLRISIKLDYTGDGVEDYVSYIDSFHKVKVDLTGNFETSFDY